MPEEVIYRRVVELLAMPDEQEPEIHVESHTKKIKTNFNPLFTNIPVDHPSEFFDKFVTAYKLIPVSKTA